VHVIIHNYIIHVDLVLWDFFKGFESPTVIGWQDVDPSRVLLTYPFIMMSFMLVFCDYLRVAFLNYEVGKAKIRTHLYQLGYLEACM